jgi:hypothetical protein
MNHYAGGDDVEAGLVQYFPKRRRRRGVTEGERGATGFAEHAEEPIGWIEGIVQGYDQFPPWAQNPGDLLYGGFEFGASSEMIEGGVGENQVQGAGAEGERSDIRCHAFQCRHSLAGALHPCRRLHPWRAKFPPGAGGSAWDCRHHRLLRRCRFSTPAGRDRPMPCELTPH